MARGTAATAEGDEGVGGLHRSVDVGERCGARTRPSRGDPCGWDYKGRAGMRDATGLILTLIGDLIGRIGSSKTSNTTKGKLPPEIQRKVDS